MLMWYIDGVIDGVLAGSNGNGGKGGMGEGGETKVNEPHQLHNYIMADVLM